MIIRLLKLDDEDNDDMDDVFLILVVDASGGGGGGCALNTFLDGNPVPDDICCNVLFKDGLVGVVLMLLTLFDDDSETFFCWFI